METHDRKTTFEKLVLVGAQNTRDWALPPYQFLERRFPVMGLFSTLQQLYKAGSLVVVQ